MKLGYVDFLSCNNALQIVMFLWLKHQSSIIQSRLLVLTSLAEVQLLQLHPRDERQPWQTACLCSPQTCPRRASPVHRTRRCSPPPPQGPVPAWRRFMSSKLGRCGPPVPPWRLACDAWSPPTSEWRYAASLYCGTTSCSTTASTAWT